MGSHPVDQLNRHIYKATLIVCSLKKLYNSEVKGVQHPQLKISMLCVLSQNYQYFFEKIIYASHSILSKELNNDIKILVG